MKCPKCHSEILNDRINIQTDVAHCIKCNHIFKISETIAVVSDDFDLNTPPSGAWIRKEWHSLVIGATTRSPIAFFLIPFMLIWSGGSIGGIYGSQIAEGKFNPFMSLFGIPFILGTIVLGSFALMAIWGKVEVTIDRDGGKIFTGIGTIGLTKRFNWNEISVVKEIQSSYRSNSRSSTKIAFEGQKRISFGLGLNDSRRYYLLKSLQQILAKAKGNEALY